MDALVVPGPARLEFWLCGVVSCPLLGRVCLIEVQTDADMIDADQLDQVLKVLDPAIQRRGGFVGAPGRTGTPRAP